MASRSKKKNAKAIGIIAVLSVVIIAALVFLSQNILGEKSDPVQQVAQAEQIETASGNDISEEPAAGEEDQKQAAAEDISEPEPGTIDGVEVQPGNPVVAKVGGSEITRREVAQFVNTLGPAVQGQSPEALYDLALERVIEAKIVQNKADSANLTNDEEVQKQLELAKQQISRNVFLQREVDKKISDDKLQKAYKNYIKNIPDVTERRARHILVETEERAKDIIAQTKDKSFEDLAKENSIGPTAPKGGDLGWFAKEMMVPEFAEVAFKLKPGDVTKEPVKTQFGWHVIKVEGERKQPKPTFEALAPNLKIQMSREILDELVQDWRKDTKVERFDINGKPIEPAAGESN